MLTEAEGNAYLLSGSEPLRLMGRLSWHSLHHANGLSTLVFLVSSEVKLDTEKLKTSLFQAIMDVACR